MVIEGKIEEDIEGGEVIIEGNPEEDIEGIEVNKIIKV